MWFNSPKELKESLLKNNFGWKLVLSCGVMAIIVWVIMQLIGQNALIEESRLAAFGYTLVGAVIGVGAFLRMIIKCNLLTLREWLSLPFGKKLLRK